jgi:hypothetical protein
VDVQAVGLGIVTNNAADEDIYLEDASGNVIQAILDTDHTDTNQQKFLGIVSATPFRALILTTSNGAAQNECITDISRQLAP